MKYIITLFVAVSLFASTNAQTEKSKILGFRDFNWGQEISEMIVDGELANFIKMEKEKEKDGDYYILAEENLMIGNVLLSSIEYVFSKKDAKFFKVILTGKKIDSEQMNFIVGFKYGENANIDTKDDRVIKEWIINNVSITMKDYTLHKFELILKSDWEAAEAYRKNTNVSDF
mgnify:FL=1|tara:strand:- start:67 stop:585 length:519 start_codon:yes stop_codon:yes gene_type:complete